MARNVRFVSGAASDLERQQQIADALTVRALRSRVPQQGGPVQVKMSPWEGVAQLGEALIAAKVQGAARKESQAQESRMLAANDAMVRQLTDLGPTYRKDASGQPTGAPVQMPTDLEGKPFLSSRGEMLAAAMAGDPRAANQALTGMTLQKALATPTTEEAYTLKPGDRRFQGGRMIASVPAEGEKEPESIRKLRILLGDPQLMDAERRLAEAGRSSVSLSTGPYEPAFDKALAEADVKTLSGMRDKADSGRSALASLDRLRTLNPVAAQGGTAQARTSAANFLNGLGMNIDPKLAASQEFDAIASRMVIDSLGGSLGTGFSNADREFVQKTVPQLGHSMEARTALISYMQGKFQDQIRNYNEASDYATRNRGLRGWNPNPRPTGVYDPVTGTVK